MAPYRPKSLDELNQAYDKAKVQKAAPPAAPTPPAPPTPQPQRPAQHSIADTVRARENTQAISGAVDDFIKQFSAKETAPQSAYAQAAQTTQAKETQVRQELAQETKQAFDDVLSFPEIKTTPPEPPVYQRYTHEEAPIKEGDLSGLMDEYIAVMTDQNGEEEKRRSFLHRRKNRKKDKQPQHTDTETAADLFDLPEPAAPAVPQPPVVSYQPPVETPPVVPPYVPPVAPPAAPVEAPVAPMEIPVAPVEIPVEAPVAPVEIPVEAPVAPVEIPFEEPVTPVEIPVEEPVAPAEIPFEEPVTPVEIPVEEPVAPAEKPFEAPVAPVEIPVEAPVTPVEIPVEAPVAPVEIPIEEPVAPVEIPVEAPVAPVEIPVEAPVAPAEIPVEAPVAPAEIPVEAPVAPVEIPVEAPVAPVEIPVEAPVAPAAPETSAMPQMPAYTPYHSPLEAQRVDIASMPEPVRTEKKPKRVINMEPEPVFDPHRLFADLDDEPEAPAVPPAMPEEAPAAFVPAAAEAAPQPEAAVPAPVEAAPAAPVPQQFEDVASYSDEAREDRFIPQEAAAEAEPAPAPVEVPEQDDDFDLAALDLQQEIVIRPSKVKVFFKIIVALLIILSLLATAAVGMVKLVLNINTGKSAFGDYYFFAVSNEYANVNIHSGDLVLAKRQTPVQLGETAVYVDPDTRSFSFGKNDASSADPEIYNALIYNLSGIAVREENVLGVVQKTVPQGGMVVRMILNDFYTYLGACAGAFVFFLLIRVLFLRKKRRYLTVEELAQAEAAAQNAGEAAPAEAQIPADGKKAKKEKKQKKQPKAKKEKRAKKADAPQAAPTAGDDDLFGDID